MTICTAGFAPSVSEGSPVVSKQFGFLMSNRRILAVLTRWEQLRLFIVQIFASAAEALIQCNHLIFSTNHSRFLSGRLVAADEL